MENKFKIKNINIEFENYCENVTINFDDGEFIKIKDTTTEIENDYDAKLNACEHQIFYFATNCGLSLQQIESWGDWSCNSGDWTYNTRNDYGIFLNLDKLDANIEISSGLFTKLQQIDEKIRLMRLQDEKEEAERKRQAEGELANEFDKNTYKFTARRAGEQHNQHWVVESLEIIEKIKKGV